ncbi:plastid transcriptionally active 13 isoform X1 [Tasmannia lanceolata]|uniref:plastid transcriptionally active 13 isoform X1 n=1 Tax=Tasmannia lanceolata TaxID=3420 RepID=UPI004063984B
MRHGLLAWNPCSPSPSLSSFPLSSPSLPSIRIPITKYVISATVDSQLTARERRQLRNERRESKTNNWKEEVEEKLLHKPKKRYSSWTEELNLDNLALLGPQWWVVRVSRVSGQATAEQLARSLARNYPSIDFKVYFPAVHMKRKLKNGSYSVKPKPLFPGCVFFRCVLNREIHDFVRECNGIGGFLGSRVGNTKRQINRPKPVPNNDMEVIFQQAKEEQEKSDQAFEEERRAEGIPDGEELNMDAYLDSKHVTKSTTGGKTKKRSKKGLESSMNSPLTGEDNKFLVPGSSVRVMSGPLVEFTGNLKQLDHKTGKATVGFMLFGKESLVNLDVDQIVAEPT